MKVSVSQEDIAGGMPGSVFSCPVALAIKRAVPEADEVIVAVSKAYAHVGDCLVSYRLPLDVQGFIISFDMEHPVQPFTFEMRPE